MDFIPERSELQVENLELKDRTVRDMVRDIGLKKLIPGKKDRRTTAAEWMRPGAGTAVSSPFWERKGEGKADLAYGDWGMNTKDALTCAFFSKSLSFALNHKLL